MAQAHHAGLAEGQDLNEQTLEGIEVAAAKLTAAAGRSGPAARDGRI